MGQIQKTETWSEVATSEIARSATLSLLALLALAALVTTPRPLPAQQLGLAATHGSTPRSWLPGGPGVQGWASVDLLGFVRVRGSLAREWGRETERTTFCSGSSPDFPPTDCVEEDVRDFTTTTSGEVTLLLLSPAWRRTRAGVGRSWGRHQFDVGREGLETGRIEAPFDGRERTEEGRGWIVVLEHGGLLGTRASLQASWQTYEVDFGECMMDVWSLCREERFSRLALGFGYRLF